MTVDDLIRELSDLTPDQRRLDIYDVDGVFVFPGNFVALTERDASEFGKPLVVLR